MSKQEVEEALDRVDEVWARAVARAFDERHEVERILNTDLMDQLHESLR